MIIKIHLFVECVCICGVHVFACVQVYACTNLCMCVHVCAPVSGGQRFIQIVLLDGSSGYLLR